jgi:hypothetical protein
MTQRVDTNTVLTEDWKFTWGESLLTIEPTQEGKCKHTYQIQGDPHFYMDNQLVFDFPQANCTFIFNDGTVLVAQAPASNQALRDCHIFTDDGQHFALGQAGPFDEQVGWLFVQQDNGEFYCTATSPITNNVGQVIVQPKYKDS